MLEAIAKGETSGVALAELAQGLLKKKTAALRKALEGRIEDHHRFMLRMQLDRLSGLEGDLASLDRFMTRR